MSFRWGVQIKKNRKTRSVQKTKKKKKKKKKTHDFYFVVNNKIFFKNQFEMKNVYRDFYFISSWFRPIEVFFFHKK